MVSEEKGASVGYVRLLSRNANFRNLWFGQLISSAGDWFNTVALLGLVLELTGNGLSAGLVLIASSLPMFLLTPIAGPVVDRFDRRKVMLVSNLLGALFAFSFLLIRDSTTVWIAYAGTALLVSTASFFGPAAGALTPTIVSREELFSANALSSSTWGIMVMVGSGLGGIMSAWLGRDLVFVFNAISFLLSNLLIWFVIPPVKINQPQSEPRSKSSTWDDFMIGITYLKQHPPVAALVAVKSGWGLAGGVLVLLAVFGNQVFKAGDAGIGLLYAARGCGALIGPIVLRPLVGNDATRMWRVIVASFVISGVGYLLFGLSEASGLWLAALALIVAHFGGGANWVIPTILLQDIVPNRILGRILSFDIGLVTLTTAISTLFYSLALQSGVSPVWMAYLGSGIFLTCALVWGIVTIRPALKINNESIRKIRESQLKTQERPLEGEVYLK
ncbi:MAG: MFS transporter [Chloroflexota bacterium]|nr:MFS transporter [Chloroflexota bacterium]